MFLERKYYVLLEMLLYPRFENGDMLNWRQFRTVCVNDLHWQYVYTNHLCK
jgi:hypothetical protein